MKPRWLGASCALAMALGLAAPALAQTTPINIGTNPNDGTGDTLRVAFGKVNADFALLGSAAFKPVSAFDPAGAAATAVAGLNLTAPVSSVAGRTGVISLTHADLTDWASATAPFALTSSLGTAASQPSSAFDAAGSASSAQTAAVAAAAAAAPGLAPVQTVAGRKGAVTLSATDISGLAPVASSGSYSSLTGLPTLGTAAAHPATDFAPATSTTAGTYTKVTVNGTGSVTAGTTLSATDLPALTGGDATTAAGSGVITLTNSVQARGDLGLGGAAVLSVGTTTSAVAAGSGDTAYDAAGSATTAQAASAQRSNNLTDLASPALAFATLLAALPPCVNGSATAPVATGKAFQCGGLILVAQ